MSIATVQNRDDDRAYGSLCGLMLADAVGFHVECAPMEEVDTLVRLLRDKQSNLTPDDLRELPPPRHYKTKGPYEHGQISDDSQLALLLCDALNATKTEPEALEEFADNVADAFAKDVIVGYGRTTQGAAARIVAEGWRNAGDTESSSNGSAMRAGPPAVFMGADLAATGVFACHQSMVTHARPVCQLAAAAVALGAALAHAPERNIIVSALYGELGELCLKGDFAPTLIRPYQYLQAWLDQPPEAVREAVLEMDAPNRHDGRVGISTNATTCALWSLYCFLNSPDDYWTAIANAISIGGDTDTVAAMTGGICGARLGRAFVPDWFGAFVHDAGQNPLERPCMTILSG